MTCVLKAVSGEICGVAARGRAAGPASGAVHFFVRLMFFRFCVSAHPYKPSVGAFVGEDVSDMFDIPYRDVFDTVTTALPPL